MPSSSSDELLMYIRAFRRFRTVIYPRFERSDNGAAGHFIRLR